MLAGVYISIASILYLSLNDKIIGAVLFSIGLLLVINTKQRLFTGYVGSVRKDTIFEAVKALGLNLVGCVAVVLLIKLTNKNDFLIISAESICQIKLQNDWLTVLILSLFCGVLMELAVTSKNNLIVVLCVTAFILCGFEHCIANFCYMLLAEQFDIIRFSIMVAGNIIGAQIINRILEYKRSKRI